MEGFLNHAPYGACPVYPDIVALGKELRIQLVGQTNLSSSQSLISNLDTVHGVGAFAAYLVSQPYLRQRSLDEQLGSFLCFGIPNQTDWFRDRNAFRALKYEVLPTYTQDRPIRIASVGCSTGMEVYSTLLAASAPGRRLELRGLDINPSSLVVARQGIFPGRNVHSGDPWSLLPIQFQDRHLVEPGSVALQVNRMGIIPSMHQTWFGFSPHPGVVTFVPHDIVTHPLSSPVEVVLLLKVLMHFPETTRQRILVNLKRSIAEDGWLLSDSEDSQKQSIVSEFLQAGFTKVSAWAPGWWGGPENISDTTALYQPTNACG